MREALLILRKDADYLRWPLGVFLLLVVAGMVIDILLPGRPELVAAQNTLGVLFLLGAVCLIYSAVRQERIVGDRQYWLTRPLPWNSILAAKALFVLLFVLLPIFVTHNAALAANGMTPMFASALLLFLALTGLFVIATASVTRTAVQFVLAVVAYIALSKIFDTVMHAFDYETDSVSWASAQSVRGIAEMVIFAAVIVAVIYLQYRNRATTISRVILAAGLLVLVIGLPGWRQAFALLERLKGPGPSRNVAIAFDSARSPEASPGSWTNMTGDSVVGVRIPIAITGIPSGTTLLTERVRTTIDAPGGRHWDSAWTFNGGIIGKGETQPGQRRITAENDYWLELNVERSFYDSANLRDTPVRLQITAALSTLSASRIALVPIPSNAYRAGPGEFCSVSIPDRIKVVITCLSAPGEDLANAEYSLTDGQHSERIGLGSTLTGASVWSVFSTTITSLDLGPPRFDGQERPLFHGPTKVQIERQKVTGYFERTLAIHAICLGTYEAGRSGPRGRVW